MIRIAPFLLAILFSFFLACPNIDINEEEWISPSIFRMDSDGTNEVRLTENGNYFNNPSFTPDGENIIFSGWGDRHIESIYICDKDGKNQTWLANGRNAILSPIGDKILYYTVGTSIIVQVGGSPIEYYSYNDLAIINIDGTDQTNLTFTPTDSINETFSSAGFSPNGDKILYYYLKYINRELVTQSVYRMNLDGSGREKMFDVDSYYTPPKFTSDGKGIVFIKSELEDVYLEKQTLLLFTIDTGTFSDITVVYGCYDFDVSSEDSKILYETKSGLRKELFTINIDGSDRQRITNDSFGNNHSARFSQDGSKIVYVQNDEYDYLSDIWVMDSDGSNAVNLTKDKTRVHNNPQFSPDGHTIVFSAEF